METLIDHHRTEIRSRTETGPAHHGPAHQGSRYRRACSVMLSWSPVFPSVIISKLVFICWTNNQKWVLTWAQPRRRTSPHTASRWDGAALGLVDPSIHQADPGPRHKPPREMRSPGAGCPGAGCVETWTLCGCVAWNGARCSPVTQSWTV